VRAVGQRAVGAFCWFCCCLLAAAATHPLIPRRLHAASAPWLLPRRRLLHPATNGAVPAEDDCTKAYSTLQTRGLRGTPADEQYTSDKLMPPPRCPLYRTIVSCLVVAYHPLRGYSPAVSLALRCSAGPSCCTSCCLPGLACAHPHSSNVTGCSCPSPDPAGTWGSCWKVPRRSSVCARA
jgi:hypothetical protein